LNDLKTFRITEEYIPLIQLLKATRIAHSGGDAQRIVEEGLVMVNGKNESRKRAKIRPGDTISALGQEVRVEKGVVL
jgi:ribosome-associated protein